ncbi:MAG TPA: VWA domain-containing protein, partial [Acidimicrobiales bacterium]
MLELLGDFVGELRAAGIPVSTTEHLDAARALVAIDLMERDMVKAALAATMVKDETHYAVFDVAFEIFFAMVGAGAGSDDVDADGDGSDPQDAAGGRGQRGRTGSGGGGSSEVDAEELAAMLFRALRDKDHAALSDAARLAVTRFAGMEPGRPVGGTYYLYRTLRNLDLDRLQRMLQAAAAGEGAVVPGSLSERLAKDDASARVELLKRAVEAEIRRRLVEDRGAAALARSVRRPLPEDLDVMHATRDELAALHRALVPLSRKMAVRLARKRRKGHRGALDLRRTVRNSMSTGGVPITPIFKPPRPAKPEIFVIADVSGSVASFARFTLLLVHAISSQFRKVRSFVFV